MYDYMLGGTHNFQVDRNATEQFHDCGIRQFIAIGSGLPTQSNTHEVVRAVSPKARV
jgi:hypothetical protein